MDQEKEWRFVIYKGKEYRNYEVSNEGEIYSLKHKKILKPGKNTKGYLTIGLFYEKKHISARVHRVVAETFIPNPDNKPQINHIDGDKTNNRVSNLEWVTDSENKRHAFSTGLMKSPVGEKNGRSKLTNEEVREIKILYVPFHPLYSIEALAKKYNVHPSAIKEIIKGKNWKSIVVDKDDLQRNNPDLIQEGLIFKEKTLAEKPKAKRGRPKGSKNSYKVSRKTIKEPKPKPPRKIRNQWGENNPSSKLTEKQIIEIHRLYNQGESKKCLARKFGVSATTIGKILTGEKWPKVFILLNKK